MAVDWFLLVIIIVMTFALLGANVYILVYFQHDDDKNTAYFPKTLVIFGLLFAECCVLLLPLDVANNSSAIGCAEGWNTACGNINMDLLWLIVFMSIIVIIVVLLPYSIFYDEADDGEDNVGNRQWCEALKMEVATLTVAIALFVVLYVTVSKILHYLQGMSFFWEYNISVYAILGFSLLTTIFLIVKPKDKSSPVDEIRKKIERQVRETRAV